MSKRKLDEYGNWRSKAVTFNMSPEEDELFEKVYKALKDEMAAIKTELERIAAGGDVSPYLLDLIRFMTEVMNGMKEESTWQ